MANTLKRVPHFNMLPTYNVPQRRKLRVARLAELVAANQQLARDPKDVPIATAAITTKADCLINSNKDLTESEELMQHIPVLLPAVFLREYMGWTSEELEAIRHRTWNDMA